MKSLIFAMILAVPALGLCAGPAPQQHAHQAQHEHAHEHHPDHAAGGTTAVVAVPQQRWATDAPLREGMQRVHAALADLQHYPSANMSAATALERVADIKAAGAYMFANCQLPEAPDQALHGMLVPLLTAAEKLENDPSDVNQVQAMQRAVANYPRYFNDPRWPAPSGSAPGKP